MSCSSSGSLRSTAKPQTARQAIRICDAALCLRRTDRSLAGDPRALRRETCGRNRTPLERTAASEAETSARGCFQWALLCDAGGEDRGCRRLARAGDPTRATGLLVSFLSGQFLQTHRPERTRDGALSSGRRPQARIAVGSMQPRAPLSQSGRMGSGARRLRTGPSRRRREPTCSRRASFSAS